MAANLQRLLRHLPLITVLFRINQKSLHAFITTIIFKIIIIFIKIMIIIIRIMIIIIIIITI